MGRPPRQSMLPKTLKRAAGRCEACLWHPPGFEWRLLHHHHVVPLRAGGGDTPENSVVLCPNCHAVAHWLGTTKGGTYVGPSTPDELLSEIRAAYRRDPRLVKGREQREQRRRMELIERARPLIEQLRPPVRLK